MKSHQSMYAKRQRRRAEKIIAATGLYSAAFRDEVQQALDRLPHKLPLLFREADEINRKLAARGSRHKKSPQRTPKRGDIRMAEEIESLFAQYENEVLDEQMTKRAELIKSVLFDLQSTAQVFCTHPKIVKAYVLAIWEALGLNAMGVFCTALSQRDFERVHQAFGQVSDLMDGCSQDRFEQISGTYSLDLKLPITARAKDASVNGETLEVVALREELSRLERLPENEATRFQLEKEIYQLEREANADGEWPQVIGPSE